jgi:hypothetical protein
MKLFILIIFFFLLGAFFIVSNYNLALIYPANLPIFLEKYTDWFFNLGKNFKNITAYAIKQEWIP